MKNITLFLFLLISVSAYAQDNKKTIESNDISKQKNTINKDKIEVLDSIRGSHYVLQKYAEAAGYEIIIFNNMKMKINGKDYNCSTGGGEIRCTEIK